MNIINAIKSGKRVRRHGWERWHENNDIREISRENLLADDWEIESKLVSITREQFNAAWGTSVKKYDDYWFADILAEELGL